MYTPDEIKPIYIPPETFMDAESPEEAGFMGKQVIAGGNVPTFTNLPQQTNSNQIYTDMTYKPPSSEPSKEELELMNKTLRFKEIMAENLAKKFGGDYTKVDPVQEAERAKWKFIENQRQAFQTTGDVEKNKNLGKTAEAIYEQTLQTEASKKQAFTNVLSDSMNRFQQELARKESTTAEETRYQRNVKTEQDKYQRGLRMDEATKIGDAIMKGDQPPELSGFGMAKIAPQVRAYLAERGFDLTTATQDWSAMKKYVSSLNSTQQVRLKQATTFSYDSLKIIEDLAKQWDGGNFPILNKVNLLAAKQGAYGKDASMIATKLDAQIADLTSELGTVYKGGNSSTDESLKLAAQNLKSEWSREVLQANIEQVRTNLGIRLNSIKHTTIGGISDNSIYNDMKPKDEQSTSKTVVEKRVTKDGKTIVKYNDGTFGYE